MGQSTKKGTPVGLNSQRPPEERLERGGSRGGRESFIGSCPGGEARRRLQRFSTFPPVILGGVVLLTSCASVPVPDRLSGGRGGSLGWKTVVEKREPGYVIAADRTTCEVSQDRYRKAREGNRFFCHWR